MSPLALALGLTIVLHRGDVFQPPKPPGAQLWEQSQAGDGAPVPMSFAAPDGTTLRGWRFAARHSRRPWLLFFYGSNEDVLIERRRLAFLAEAFDVNTVAFDYRGYGFSGGELDAAAIRSDALSAFDAVQLSAGVEPVVVYGWSVGADIAIHVAANRPAAALILQAPPASAEGVARAATNHDVPWPVRWLVTLRHDDETHAVLQGAAEIRSASQPLLVLQGDRDDVVPMSQAQEVLAASPAVRKSLVVVTGAHHNDLRISIPPARAALQLFLDSVVR